MSFAMQFDFLISEPNCERVSRICDVDIYIYIHFSVYIYICFSVLRHTVRVLVCPLWS